MGVVHILHRIYPDVQEIVTLFVVTGSLLLLLALLCLLYRPIKGIIGVIAETFLRFRAGEREKKETPVLILPPTTPVTSSETVFGRRAEAHRKV